MESENILKLIFKWIKNNNITQITNTLLMDILLQIKRRYIYSTTFTNVSFAIIHQEALYIYTDTKYLFRYLNTNLENTSNLKTMFSKNIDNVIGIVNIREGIIIICPFVYYLWTTPTPSTPTVCHSKYHVGQN
jgi:hypothetical protein